MKTKPIISFCVFIMSATAMAEPLPLPPAHCAPSRDEKGKVIVGSGGGPGCDKPIYAPGAECSACLYGCYATSDGGTRCAYPPPEVGDFPIGASEAETAGHSCSMSEVEGIVVGDCNIYGWSCDGIECEDSNGARWGDLAAIDELSDAHAEPTSAAECKPVECDTDGFAGAVICYGDEDIWTCSSNNGTEWFCVSAAYNWSTDCPSCGSPAAEIERLANKIDPTSTIPSGCSWSPGDLEGECRYSCNGWLKAACRVTYDGSSTVCRQSDGQTSVHKGQITC
jgi:hypothetical protein